MSLQTRNNDFDGVFVDPKPAPKIIRGDEQRFYSIAKSYTDELEERLDRAKATARKLEAEVQRLRAELENRPSLVVEDVGLLKQELRLARKEIARLSNAARDLSAAQKALGSAQQSVSHKDREIERLRGAVAQKHQELLDKVEADAGESPGTVHLGRLSVDILRQRIELNGKVARLTPAEASIMAILASHPDQIFGTATLCPILGAPKGSIRSCLWRLREKAKQVGATEYLRSKGSGGAGGGYWVSDPEAQHA